MRKNRVRVSSVVSSCKDPDDDKMGGLQDYICCRNTGRWHEDRRPMIKHGSVVRPTMYLASMDIKTAFDVARPNHIAQIMRITIFMD